MIDVGGKAEKLHRKDEGLVPFPGKLSFKVLMRVLGLTRDQEVYKAEQYWSGSGSTRQGPIIALHSISPDKLSDLPTRVKSLPKRRISSPVGTKLQPFPSPNIRFLGKFQFLQDHLLSHLTTERNRRYLFKIPLLLAAPRDELHFFRVCIFRA